METGSASILLFWEWEFVWNTNRENHQAFLISEMAYFRCICGKRKVKRSLELLRTILNICPAAMLHFQCWKCLFSAQASRSRETSQASRCQRMCDWMTFTATRTILWWAISWAFFKVVSGWCQIQWWLTRQENAIF